MGGSGGGGWRSSSRQGSSSSPNLSQRVALPPTLSQVSFEVSDAAKRDFPPGSFDVVISRDTLLHIEDKPAVFRR